MSEHEKLDLILSEIQGIKQDLRQEIQETKQELQQGMQEIKQELQQEIQETKQELQQEIQETKQELQQEIQETKQELQQEIQETKQELQQEIQETKQELQELETQLETIEGRMKIIEQKTTKVELQLENGVRTNIQLLAENFVDLTRKLNQAIPVADKNLAYEVKVNYLLEEVEQLKKHVKELMKSA